MDDGFENALKVANKKHDLIAVRVYDKREMNIPNIGLARLRDAETGKIIWVDTGSSKLRSSFRDRFNRRDKELNEILLKSGLDAISVRTDQDYIKPLINMFKRRASRI